MALSPIPLTITLAVPAGLRGEAIGGEGRGTTVRRVQSFIVQSSLTLNVQGLRYSQ